MSVIHYRLAAAFAASLSLALAGCGASPPASPPSAVNAQQAAAAEEPEDIDTEATLWTMLGLAKKESEVRRQPGPRTGPAVSPILWQAALDTLDFVKLSSQDPLAGSMISEWYSPPGKPNERYKITVFILDRALRSDSVTVTVERQERSASGQWTDTTIARQVETDLETAILHRARHLRRAWAPVPS